MKRMMTLGLALFLSSNAAVPAQEKLSPPKTVPPAVAPAMPGTGAPVEVLASGPVSCYWWQCGTGQGYRIWGSADFLLWWTKDAQVDVPLVTQALDVNDPTSGQIGSANTAVLLGDRSYGLGTRYGGRFTVGAWLDQCQTIGVEGSYFFISPRSSTTGVSTDGTPGSPLLGIPFIDALNGQEAVAFAGGNVLGIIAAPGSAYLRTSNRIQGAEFNVVACLGSRENLSITGLVGFRYLNFHEDLTFGAEASIPALGAGFAVQDNFSAANNFYGGQLGLRGEYRLGRAFIEATGKIAIGSMNQVVTINGTSTTFAPGVNVVGAPGGFFAQNSNSGSHVRNVFTFVPEVEVKLGYNITQNLSATVGYNFMYLNDVARPGTAIDRNINLAQAAGVNLGPTAPTFSFDRSDFWAQGINFGMQFKY